MTVTGWMPLLLLWVCCHYDVKPSSLEPRWMSPLFPCDVKTNETEVKFDCRMRHLKKVPPGITGDATVIDLSENAIANISGDVFSGLLNLTTLYVNWANVNKVLLIGDDVFKNLTKLNHLGLNGNNLREIPGNLPPSVETLDLGINKLQLDKMNLSGLTYVINLWLAKNCYVWNPCGRDVTIMHSPFAVLTKLQTLELSFNNLTHVPRGLPQSLTELRLASNKIQNISGDDFKGLHNLKTLHIQGNCPRCQNAPFPCFPCPNRSLGIHPDAFHNLTELRTLQMGGNSLEHLNPNWFKSLNKLKDLYLSFNYLLKVITGDATFLRYLPNLEKIDLSFNFGLKLFPKSINLSQDFVHLKSLRTLQLEALVFQSIGPNTLRPLYELKNLTALNLGTNFIIECDSNIFRSLSHVKLIYLAENRLYPILGKSSRYLSDENNQRSDFSFSHPKDPTFEVSSYLIKKECFNSGRVLSLSSNNIFFISQNQFEGYGNIACLNLSGNGFSAALNGTEFHSLPNLTYLDLSYNKIDLAYDYAFKELQKLQVLDLSYNPHYFQSYGISHNLNFLRNLPVLRVLNMSHNAISTLTTKQLCSKSLSELQFTNNRLGTLWKIKDVGYKMLFSNLTNLTYLDISDNKIKEIPDNVYQYIPHNLTKLCISHNLLTGFKWDALKIFHQLQVLDLSFNSLSDLTGINSNFTQTLIFLDLSHNNIFHLDEGFIKGPKSLSILSLSYNKLTTINQSTFLPRPDNPIQILYLQKNPFQCTCDSLDFILWIEDSKVKIPKLTTEVKCETPANQKDQALIKFDIKQCINDRWAFRMYILTTSFIITFMFVATTTHLFYWDASYVIHYMIAKLKGYRSLNSSNSFYDVFVTYDNRDPHVSEWVMSNLRVKLEEEGEKYLPLCLEERDWVPGVPVLDNLTYSIQYSRKTLFVLTEGYVKSGVFKLAMYLAHQRLMDENVDVIVLLMLEPVLQHSRFLRLRKRLCGRSVVEWPRTAAAEPWFWQNLRNVVRVDNQLMYNQTYSKYLTSR
ncbi:toll-like receptor 8 [Limanda limanda]|uniref:toll-like receptor 8 n=1 Tax=Limanda limanda TaxID=27771 RepID=UPI0029C650A1|nr:toll-like receptor 8 [Limanda limanda]